MTKRPELRRMDPANGPEAFVLGALHFWRACRRARRPTLPALHRRLASAGALMLAVPLDDFFGLCAARRTDEAGRGGNGRTRDDAAVLSLLRAADQSRLRLDRSRPDWTPGSLLLLSAWAVRRQIAGELGLRFGTDRPSHACRTLTRTFQPYDVDTNHHSSRQETQA